MYHGQFLHVILRCFFNNFRKYHSEISLFCLLDEHTRSKKILVPAFAELGCELGFEGDSLGPRVFLEILMPRGLISWLGLTGLFEHSFDS